MKRFLIITPMVAILSACNVPSTPDGCAVCDEKISRQAEAAIEGGPPKQEVALNYYSTLINIAHLYPALRPAILKAMDDDKVTYAEYFQIEGDAQQIALQRGAEIAHHNSDALRKKLVAAARGKA
jgi:hypothetical protein